MNNLSLWFRAQSLDNRSPDPMESNNQRLTEEEVNKRQELAQKISKVSLRSRLKTTFFLFDPFE